MKVLIAGATGLIGSKLAEDCREEGITVHYLTTRKEKIENLPTYKGFYWNPNKGEIDINAFIGVTIIINLAGATIAKRWTSSYKKKIISSRIDTANLLHKTLSSIKHEVGHYISASGISIYPNHKTRLYTEDSVEIDHSFLAKVVVAWEAAADQFESLDISVTKLRTGVVLASEMSALQQIVKPIRMNLGAVLGNGNQWMSWIHIDDISQVYLHCMNKKLFGVVNGVALTPVTNRKITKRIARLLDKLLWLPSVPGFVLKLILGEMAVLVLEGQLVAPNRLENSGFRYRHQNIEAALQDLL